MIFHTHSLAVTIKFFIDLLLSGCNWLVMKLYRNRIRDLIQNKSMHLCAMCMHAASTKLRIRRENSSYVHAKEKKKHQLWHLVMQSLQTATQKKKRIYTLNCASSKTTAQVYNAMAISFFITIYHQEAQIIIQNYSSVEL